MKARRNRLLLALGSAFAVALAVAGGGRTDEQVLDADVAEEIAGIEEEAAKEGSSPGLGEASPPPPDAELWKTDFSKRLVPLDEIKSGGPPKDGIPAIDEPQFTPAHEVDWLDDREPLILVKAGGETRAYPIQILMWHEIANDELGGIPIAVTFCPLCNTAIVFDRRLDGDVYSFGTTGKLRDSDLVMYDRQTESWWQQFGGKALVGELAGKELEHLPARIVSWEELRRDHPVAPVLNRDTGFVREYGTNPYSGYDAIDSSPLFATRNEDDNRLPPKERVVYVEIGGTAYAVPFSSLAEERTITLDTGAGELVVRWRRGIASALDEATVAHGRNVGAATVHLKGEPVPFHEPFWFAVAAFRPDIEIVDRSP